MRKLHHRLLSLLVGVSYAAGMWMLDADAWVIALVGLVAFVMALLALPSRGGRSRRARGCYEY